MGGLPIVGDILRTPDVPEVAMPVYDVEAEEKKAETDAAEVLRKKKAAQSRTIFTTPLGISKAPETRRKTLLGQ